MEQPQIIEEHLPVALTDEELLEHGVEAANMAEAISDLEAAHKVVREDHKDEVAGLNRELKRHLSIIRVKEENRPVPCTWMFDSPTRGSKSLVRGDTGEIVREEVMEGDDLQPDLPLDETPSDPAA